MQPDFGRCIAHPVRARCLAPRLFLGGSRHAAPSAIDLCQPRMRSQEAPRDLSGADGWPDPLGAPGGPHCAGVSEGRPQGATAASAVGDAARALRSIVLQPERPDDGGPACEAESIRRFAGVSLDKVPDETTTPTSAIGWSATDWRTSCSGDQGSPGRAGGFAEEGRHRRPGTRATPAIRRCTGPGRGTSGISG